MGRRRAAIALVVLTLIATGCSGGSKKASDGAIEEDEIQTPVGAQTYTIDVDVPSPEGKNLQASVFLPINLQVRPNDTIVFENRSTQAPHTVTFMPKEAMTPGAYSPVTKTGLANPLVFAACYTATVPAAGAEACPEPAPTSPPPYAGTGFWSSGALAPATAPPGASRSVTLKVGSEAAPDSYTYTCLLHPNMSGLIEVVDSDDLRKPPAASAKQGRWQRSAVLNAAGALTEPPPSTVDGPSVVSGWGDATTAVNRFGPSVLNVKVGQSVTWKGASPFEPHTVTFESPFKGPEDAGVFTPGGAKTGARYAGGFAHSGLIGPKPAPSESFSLVFTKPGTYSYVCVLHAGMAGQVVVTQ